MSSGGASGGTSECRTRMRMSVPLLRGQGGVSLQERGHDLADQLLIRDALACGNETHVGILRAKAGQRIHLDEMRPPLTIASYVDSPAVAATKTAPRRERDVAGRFRFGRRRADDVEAAVPVLLVDEAVAMAVIAGDRDDL